MGKAGKRIGLGAALVTALVGCVITWGTSEIACWAKITSTALLIAFGAYCWWAVTEARRAVKPLRDLSERGSDKLVEWRYADDWAPGDMNIATEWRKAWRKEVLAEVRDNFDPEDLTLFESSSRLPVWESYAYDLRRKGNCQRMEQDLSALREIIERHR